MKKILLGATIFLFTITSYAQNKTNESIEKSFNWVVVDKNDLQRLTYDRLKKETSYPKEIIDESKAEEKRREISINLSKFEKQEREKCNQKISAKGTTEKSPSQARDMEGAVFLAEPNGDKPYTILNSKEYQECYSKISSMKEHDLLESQQNEISNQFQKRREFEETIRKKAESILEAIISEYGQKNQIQLIIGSRSDSIIYNRDLVVLDVTPKIKAIINSKKSLNE